MKLRSIVFSPNNFFDHFSNQKPNKSGAIFLVLLNGLLTACSAALFSRNLMPNTPNSSGAFALIVVAGGIFIGLISWLFNWLPIRIFLKVNCRKFEIAAWTLIPQIFTSAIMCLLAIFFPFYLIDSTDGLTQENITGVFTGTFGQAITYIGILWSIFLIYSAVNTIGGDNKLAKYAVCLSIVITIGLKIIFP